MEKKLLFLGPLYPREDEEEIRANSIFAASNAPNVFQWNLLDGLCALAGERLRILNVLPVGTWPRAYKKICLPDADWRFGATEGHSIGSPNLPFLKQLVRSVKAKRILRRLADENTEIILYSAYMPFLRALYKLPKTVKITAIITDLPEFYDLGKTSRAKRRLRQWQNRMIDRYLRRVDRFVLLTDRMEEPLHVGNRPKIRMEGICQTTGLPPAETPGEKKAILYSGTLHNQYGIRNLLRAFEKLQNEEAELWICGSGEAEAEIKNLAGRDNRVRFFGFCTQEEVASLRAKAAVLVNPRTNDGEYTRYSFPSKTMEYMASGIPVVMYKLDGIPDEYDEYLNYADPSGAVPERLSEALEKVLSDYESAQKKAKRARNFVLENKNGIRQAERLLRLLDEKPGERPE